VSLTKGAHFYPTTGLVDAFSPEEAQIIGFVGGTAGLFLAHTITITKALMAPYRNQGGFGTRKR
jgi:6-phosphofructokinase